MEADLSNFTIPLDTPISKLDAGKSFEGLENKERLYCHYLSRASWEGCSICLFQTSPESVPVFLLLRELFTRQSLSSLRKSCEVTISDDEFKVYCKLYVLNYVCVHVCVHVQAFLLYACAVFSNMGNYKSFGDTKIVPSIEKVGVVILELVM